jgi:hypothetical protein
MHARSTRAQLLVQPHHKPSRTNRSKGPANTSQDMEVIEGKNEQVIKALKPPQPPLSLLSLPTLPTSPHPRTPFAPQAGEGPDTVLELQSGRTGTRYQATLRSSPPAAPPPGAAGPPPPSGARASAPEDTASEVPAARRPPRPLAGAPPPRSAAADGGGPADAAGADALDADAVLAAHQSILRTLQPQTGRDEAAEVLARTAMRLLLPPPSSPPMQPMPPPPCAACPAHLGSPAEAAATQPPLLPSLVLPQAFGPPLASASPAHPPARMLFSPRDAYAAGAAAAAAAAAAHIGSPVSASWGFPLVTDHAGGHQMLSESVTAHAQPVWEWSPASGGTLSHSPSLYHGSGCCFSPPLHH